MKTTIQKLKALYKECFSDSNECVEYLFNNRLGIYNAYYGVIKDDIATAMYLVDKTLRYGKNSIKTPFIVGLATSQNHRKKGLAFKLMKDTLSNIGNPFVMLYPAVKGFYEKMDFAVISYDNILTDEYMKIDCNNASQLLDIYNLYNKENDFYIKLTLDDFYQKINIVEKDNGKFQLLSKNGSICGFTNGEETIILGKKPTRSGVMARVINLKKAFELRKISVNTKIKLTDKLIDKNNITFYVDKGQVIECKDYDLEMSMADLSLHFFGLGKKLKGFDNFKGHIMDRY